MMYTMRAMCVMNCSRNCVLRITNETDFFYNHLDNINKMRGAWFMHHEQVQGEWWYVVVHWLNMSKALLGIIEHQWNVVNYEAIESLCFSATYGDTDQMKLATSKQVLLRHCTSRSTNGGGHAHKTTGIYQLVWYVLGMNTPCEIIIHK